MPKRSNPYSEDVPQQVKIHIGVKEVDLGVNKDQNMKVVYERTRRLLFGMSQMCESLSSRSAHAFQNTVNGIICQEKLQSVSHACKYFNSSYMQKIKISLLILTFTSKQLLLQRFFQICSVQ